MSAGAKIGPGATFYKSEALMASVYYGGGGLNLGGKWVDKTGYYLGLRFQINGETHYGWARMNVQVNTTKLTVSSRITGYAYETTPNKPIAAGQIHDDVTQFHSPSLPVEIQAHTDIRHSVSPNPSDRVQHAILGALALGAEGIAIWRREESSEANPSGQASS